MDPKFNQAFAAAEKYFLQNPPKGGVLGSSSALISILNGATVARALHSPDPSSALRLAPPGEHPGDGWKVTVLEDLLDSPYLVFLQNGVYTSHFMWGVRPVGVQEKVDESLINLLVSKGYNLYRNESAIQKPPIYLVLKSMLQSGKRPSQTGYSYKGRQYQSDGLSESNLKWSWDFYRPGIGVNVYYASFTPVFYGVDYNWDEVRPLKGGFNGKTFRIPEVLTVTFQLSTDGAGAYFLHIGEDEIQLKID